MAPYFKTVFTSCENIHMWNALYSWLFLKVKSWVYASEVPVWVDQIEDVAYDIVHESIARTFNYAQRAALGEVPPIASLKSFSLTVARHHFQDLRRKELRLVHFTHFLSSSSQVATHPLNMCDPLEELIDTLDIEEICTLLATIIVHKMPDKQQIALLIALTADLPDPPFFMDELTPLQRALLCEGVQLQNYRQELPHDPQVRSRHAANLSLACKRVIEVYKSTLKTPLEKLVAQTTCCNSCEL